MELFQGQFLFTKLKTEGILLQWNRCEIEEFTLLSHPNLSHTQVLHENTEIHLLGEIYDWVNPFQTNEQILTSLAKHDSWENFLDELASYTGRFVIIYRSEEHLFILNDATAQHEIYYNNNFAVFGSQPKIIELVNKHYPHTEKVELNFFKSKAFLNRGVFYGNKTHVQNIKHLQPNHHLNIKSRKLIRHYPGEPLIHMPVNEAAGRAGIMLKGYLKAIAHRERLAMGVTAGYDSRVLFLSSLDLPCNYFVHTHPHMSNTHDDITISDRLTKLFDKELTIIPTIPRQQAVYPKSYAQSIDFPRFWHLPGVVFSEHTYITGNVGKIARNYLGYNKKPSARYLALLSGYKNAKAVINEYQEWLDTNEKLFASFGYNTLDMFYWEEIMGNWGAKTNSESYALGMKLVSPFNSRLLLTILLSTERKSRDAHTNALFDKIIELLAPEAVGIPLNQVRRHKAIEILRRLRLYNAYRFLDAQLQIRNS